MMRFLLVLFALLQVCLEWNFGLLISVFFWYSGSTIFFSTPFPCATLLERHHILTLWFPVGAVGMHFLRGWVGTSDLKKPSSLTGHH